jgi:membrane associated rhomboid family serine protease
MSKEQLDNNPLSIDISKSLHDRLIHYGDRTSSFLTVQPPFVSTSYLQHQSQGIFEIVGNEPLCEGHERAALFDHFAKNNKKRGRRTIMTPVSQPLAATLAKMGYHSYSIGPEPIFDLDKYLTSDPLHHTPLARSLQKRGAVVEECWPLDTDDPLNAQTANAITELTEQWIKQKPMGSLGFLNKVSPLIHGGYKRYFVLKHKNKIQAYLTAVPVYPRKAYYFSEYIRSPQAKAGTVELLIIEAMRHLHNEGIKEIRLGLCPLAQINAPGLWGTLAKYAYRHGGSIYNFRGIYEFKAKLKPTRWEPLYMVLDHPMGISTLYALWRLFVPAGLIGPWLKKQFPRSIQKFAQPKATAPILTLSVVSLCLLIHVAQTLIGTLYEHSGFRGADFSLSPWALWGWLTGPLFHNNSYHLAGDLVSFLIFGWALEYLTDKKTLAWVTALGFWASNPLALLLLLPLKYLQSPLWTKAINEVDYGSSNAIYAIVGALAAAANRPWHLLLPFALNGIYLCFAKSSPLAVHHIVALAIGWIYMYIQLSGAQSKNT